MVGVTGAGPSFLLPEHGAAASFRVIQKAEGPVMRSSRCSGRSLCLETHVATGLNRPQWLKAPKDERDSITDPSPRDGRPPARALRPSMPSRFFFPPFLLPFLLPSLLPFFFFSFEISFRRSHVRLGQGKGTRCGRDGKRC